VNPRTATHAQVEEARITKPDTLNTGGQEILNA